MRGPYHGCNWPHGHAADAHESSTSGWVMLEIQKYSIIYGLNESNARPLHGGQNRFTNSPNWRSNSPVVGLRYGYSHEIHSDVAGTRSVQSPLRRYMLRSAYLAGVRRVASHVRAQLQLCACKIVSLCVCIWVCVYVCVFWGLFGCGACPCQWNGAWWMALGKTQCLLQASLRDAATDCCFFSVCEK